MKVNPIGQYILDGQGNPVLEPDPHRWSEWRFSEGGMERRQVAETYIPYGEGNIHVSTVFLGDPHPMIDSADWALFETMVFGPDEIIHHYIPRRYVTRADAIQGHAQMVQFVEVALTKLSEVASQAGDEV